jgi:Trypsin-like peptidase domain
MTGWDAGSAGIDPERVAELLVDLRGTRPGRRGSGYRVSASAILTAAHVVRDAARVQVRFNADRPGEWMTEGTVAWSDSTVDAAVVTITPRPQDEGQVAPVTFGRVAERDAVLACSAMGFPRFKLRDDAGQPLDDGSPSQYRDSVHAVGTIAVLSNRREGTLEVSVAPPEGDPDAERSPWEGMSGAAVWSAGRIIGLVAEHHRADGLGRLAAIRVDSWYEQLTPERFSQLRNLLPVLPALASGVVDVVPATPGELLEAGYTAQVRDIAPDALLGREQELAKLVRFCAGEDRYQWWHADAWAGKSALAAWFVLHPPAGVSVVSFFVTGRLAGQADSDAFTEAMIEQLAAVAGESVAGTVSPAGRDRERRRLLDQAARRVGERHERLVLVVDGLDEDEGTKPGSTKPSIASLLPKRPPESVRVLVTSRPHPGIPADVPGDHPLRRCRLHPLTPSPYAHDVEVDAKHELLQQLHGDQLQVDIIGFISAAGGGLTLTELAELTRQPRYLLDGKLGSVFGRSLKARLHTDRSPEEAAERVYLFAHETLRAIAEEELAGDLDPYWQRINAWADEYRMQGWPARTPRYLLRPYGRLLATSGDLPRLIVLATDAARHDRMLAYTQGDAAAIAEIAATQQLILSQRMPDLVALGRLAVHGDRLANRNREFPIELLALWVRLGESRRGEALARSVTNPSDQAEALTTVADALIDVDRDRALTLIADAEQTARSIPTSDAQVEALTTVADALIDVDRDRALTLIADAEQTARGISSPDEQGWALQAVAEALAEAGQRDQAERLARGISDPDARAEAMGAVAKAQAEAGQWDQAEQTARGVPDPSAQAEALTAVAKALAEVDRDRALAVMVDAEQTARSAPDSDIQTWTLQAVTEALAEAGQWDQAEQTARSIPTGDAQVEALTTVAKALAAVDQDRALALMADAEQTARGISSPDEQGWALQAVAEALAEAGQWDQAERLARSIPDPNTQARAVIAVARALVEVDRDRALALIADAEHTARGIPSPDEQGSVLQAVAEGLAEAGQWEPAERLARGIPDPSTQAEALTAVAKALIDIDRDRALTLIADAEQTARSIPTGDEQVEALTTVAGALAAVDQDRALALMADAEQTARSIPNPSFYAMALTTVAEALADTGQWDQAERTARIIPNPVVQAQIHGTIAKALTTASTQALPARSEPLRVRACRLLADVLAGESWVEAVQPLGKLSPLGIAAIYDALHALNSWPGSNILTRKEQP